MQTRDVPELVDNAADSMSKMNSILKLRDTFLQGVDQVTNTTGQQCNSQDPFQQLH